MTEVLEGHKRINEIIEKYHETASPLNEAIREVESRKKDLLTDVDNLKAKSTKTVDEKIEQTKELVKKDKEFKTILDVESQLKNELEEKTRSIKDKLASEIVRDWDTPLQDNFAEVVSDYKNLSNEIKEKVKKLEEKHNNIAREKTGKMLEMLDKVNQVLNDDDLIKYEKLELKLEKTDVYPISHFNRDLEEFVDLLKEGY